MLAKKRSTATYRSWKVGPDAGRGVDIREGDVIREPPPTTARRLDLSQ